MKNNNHMGKLEDALKELNKSYGEGTVASIKDRGGAKIEAIPTNCMTLDWIFGCGGLPRGRIIELYGKESSGKSTMAMFLVGQVQKQGGKAVWIDAEFSFSDKYAKNLGVDTDALILSLPEYGEQALEIARKTIATNEIDIVVIDSVAGLTPKKELEGDIEKQDIALQARMMSKALRVLGSSIAQTKTVMLMINQTRERIGVFWGNPETTPGGKALKFYASARIKVRPGKDPILNSSKTVVGNHLVIKATKNKVGMPFREGEIDLYFNKGIDLVSDLFDTAVRYEVISRAGASYSFGDKKLGVGRDTAKKMLEDEKLAKQIKEQIKIYAKKEEEDS